MTAGPSGPSHFFQSLANLLFGLMVPVRAQVVHRAPDGGIALQLPDFDQEAGASVAALFEAIEEVKA